MSLNRDSFCFNCLSFFSVSNLRSLFDSLNESANLFVESNEVANLSFSLDRIELYVLYSLSFFSFSSNCLDCSYELFSSDWFLFDVSSNFDLFRLFSACNIPKSPFSFFICCCCVIVSSNNALFLLVKSITSSSLFCSSCSTVLYLASNAAFCVDKSTLSLFICCNWNVFSELCVLKLFTLDSSALINLFFSSISFVNLYTSVPNFDFSSANSFTSFIFPSFSFLNSVFNHSKLFILDCDSFNFPFSDFTSLLNSLSFINDWFFMSEFSSSNS
mmetsp:Transcript_10516/g.15376  ORF Transcript_10516/g.15376 Transcript_10516/m.15376 type:complete len:273 (-) Transcript_10516:252-1070(-)